MKNKKDFLVLGLALGLIACASAVKDPSPLTGGPAPGVSGYAGHGAGSVDEATIKKFAAPALAPETSRKIQMMMDLRAPGGGKLTLDGGQLFFNWRVTGSSQVWKLTGPNRFPQQMTGGEDRTAILTITPDSRWIVVSRDRRGEENPGIYLQPLNGGELEVVQHKPKVQTVLDYVSDDSKSLYFHSNDVRPDSYAIYKYDLNTKSTIKIFDREGLWSIADVNEKLGLALLEKTTGSLWSEFFLWDMQTTEIKPLLGQDEKEEYVVQFGARAGEYIVTTNKFSDFRRVYLYKDGKFSPLSPDLSADVSSTHVDHPRKNIYYVVNDGGYTRLFAMDALNFKSIRVPQFSGADHVYISSVTRTGRYVTVEVETPQSPRFSMVWDRDTDKLTKWVFPSAPETDLKRFVPSRLEKYPARDGTMIPMFVRKPSHCAGAGAQADPCSVVVNFHGGPEGQSIPGFSAFAQLFVDAGFVYVEPNVRGSDGYGRKWLESDNGPKRLNVISDIEDAAIFIKKAWAVNGVAPKVGVMGGSYGGYSTLMAMTRFAGAYDAGVAIVGMSNLLTFLENTAPYRRKLRATEYGDPEKDRAALLELSPSTYVDRLRSPLMIIQGVSDPRVPAGEAVQIQKELEKRRISHQLILFADEGHGASKRENQVLEWGHTLRFFENYLKSK